MKLCVIIDFKLRLGFTTKIAFVLIVNIYLIVMSLFFNKTVKQ